MKKTLVIHPKDDSTDFLKGIYTELPNTIVVDFSLSRKDLKTLINMCHRIIMLGHGSSSGLFDSLQKSYLIDSNLAECLKGKECIGIWCYASEFAKKYNIPGFWSEMSNESVMNTVSVLTKDDLEYIDKYWERDEENNVQ